MVNQASFSDSLIFLDFVDSAQAACTNSKEHTTSESNNYQHNVVNDGNCSSLGLLSCHVAEIEIKVIVMLLLLMVSRVVGTIGAKVRRRLLRFIWIERWSVLRVVLRSILLIGLIHLHWYEFVASNSLIRILILIIFMINEFFSHINCEASEGKSRNNHEKHRNDEHLSRILPVLLGLLRVLFRGFLLMDTIEVLMFHCFQCWLESLNASKGPLNQD